jgi:hypothetical protein
MCVRVSVRNYFSSYLLWSAEHASARAAEIEAAFAGPIHFDPEHRACVLTAVLASSNFLEAMINELYQDAHDGHGISGDGYLAPLADDARQMLARLWSGTAQGSKLRPLEKYQLLLIACGQPTLDQGAAPYQDAQLVIQLRNAIAHYQPEDLSIDTPSKIERELKGKFADNSLMAGPGNPWWPDHCLGHGCAEWAWQSALALADRVSSRVGISPNYSRLRKDSWSGLGKSP